MQCRVSDNGSSKSSGTSKISVEHVNNILERLKSRQTRDSTANNYLSVWRHLSKFIISLDFSDNLSWEDKTALFGAYLVEGGIQSSTLKSYFSAIKHVLKQDGYEWNENKVLLSSLVKSCKLENDRVKIRLPIQRGLLEMMLFEVQRYFNTDQPQPYLEALYKAILCLGYYGMLRVREMTLSPHTIKASDVHVAHNKDKILLVLYTSKTHGEESGPQKVKISAVPVRNHVTKFFCPIKVVIHYVTIRGTYKANNEEFFVFADRSPVKPQQLRIMLRTLLDRLNLDSSLYDVHSLRSGRTCDLAKYGYSVDQIKAMGRWKSNAVYRYLKN